MDLSKILFVLGVGFLLANLRLALPVHPFSAAPVPGASDMAGTPSALLRDSDRLGAVLSLLIVYKLAVLRWHPSEVFGETMMLVYYGYAVPLSLKIGRGFYEDGIWADGGFVPYSRIGGMAWREDEQLTLVLLDRVRDFGRRLTVPESYYGAARRVLRDKIAAHDIHFTGKSLDLSDHDERDVI